MANTGSDTKKSNIWIFVLAGLVVLSAIAGVWFYHSNQQAADVKAETGVANSDQETQSTAPAKKQAKSQKKESGSMIDKLKNIEVHGTKNPCTETQRMMKQCSD